MQKFIGIHLEFELWINTKLISWFMDPVSLFFQESRRICKLTISGCGKHHVNSVDHRAQYGDISVLVNLK